MSSFLVTFPIHGLAPDARQYRVSLNQLPELAPDDVTITSEWTGTSWPDPEGRQWWIMPAHATGTPNEDALANVWQAATPAARVGARRRGAFFRHAAATAR